MESLGQRLARLLAAKGVSQSELARFVGVSPQSVQLWVKDGTTPKDDKLEKCAMFFGITPSALKFGDETNVTPVNTVFPAVPLISWVQAGTWADIVDNYLPGSGEELRAAYTSKPGQQSFALRVEGDSMVSHNHTSFPEGTILIVDPARAPAAGDYVIAKDTDTQKATFKRLMQDGGRWFLKPLNPSYPAIPIDDPAIRVIGVVIESQNVQKL